jgi:hypothetical protein
MYLYLNNNIFKQSKMADLKPIGSEKLSVDDKLKRILELTYYQKPNNTITTPVNNADFIRESVNGGVYGIVKERNEYYVKQGLTENTLDYIGGMFMKNKNKFTSFGDALKRVDFLCGQETLTEATKYVLKQPKPKPAPAPEPQAEASIPSAPMTEPPQGGDLPPMQDDGMGGGQDDGMGGQDDGMGNSGMDQDGGMGDDERLKLIQKLTGRLGQKLRGYKDKLDSDGIKYILNSILSAVDVEKLDDSAREEIISHFEEDDNGDNGMGGQDSGMDGGDTGDADMGEDVDMDETMNKLNNLVNTPLTDENEDFDFDTIDRAYNQQHHNSDNVVQGEDSIDTEVDEDNNLGDDDDYRNEDDDYLDHMLNMMRSSSFDDDKMGNDTERHHNDEIGDEEEYFNLEDDPNELPINTSDEEGYEGEFHGLEPDYFSQYKGDDEFEDPAIADEKHFSKGNFGFSLNEDDPIENENQGEMSLDEITNEINANIKHTLSKYFK